MPARVPAFLTDRFPGKTSRDPDGFTTLHVDDTNGEDASCKPEALCPCIPTVERNNRLHAFWPMPRVKPSIFGMFCFTILALIRICSSFRPAWPPIRLMLAGPTLASRSGSSKWKGTFFRSLHTQPLPATHGPIGFCRGNDRFTALINGTNVEQSSTHHRVAPTRNRYHCGI